MRKLKKHIYVPGDYYVTCDISGLKVKYSETKSTWDNLLVRSDIYDPRQPQDFVRGRSEDIAAENPRSGWLDDNFISVGDVTPEDL